MDIAALDHLYAETRDWEASVAFWHGLGFAFAEQWGSEGHRAGRLTSGDASVVLAEIPPGDHPPAFNPFFRVEGLEASSAPPGVEVVTAPEPTHWGTRWMRVRDPEGRVYSLEEEAGGG